MRPEATIPPVGTVEYEHWVTWKTAKEVNRDYDKFEFRNELEYAMTEKLNVGFYFSDWSYTRDRTGPSEDERISEGSWDALGLELIYNLTDPVADPLGLALYGEIKGGNDLLELEGKIIAQKNFGSWMAVYNLTLEAEWEGERLVEDKGEIVQTAGLSYQFHPSFTAGFELVHELHMDDWQGIHGKPELYLGPNFSYRAETWWVTVTPLFQVTDKETAEDFQMRILFGVNLTDIGREPVTEEVES